jgi:hypothetical protein
LFQKLFVVIPPSSNQLGSKPARRFKAQVQDWIGDVSERYRFASDDKLYGRIFYFNHSRVAVRDIHNIIKPLFDGLESYLFHDDKQILHFEGVRLDMERSDFWFEVEYDLSAQDLQYVLTETCCLIQVSKLPETPPDVVKVTWL